jgi:hypothetical protein
VKPKSTDKLASAKGARVMKDKRILPFKNRQKIPSETPTDNLPLCTVYGTLKKCKAVVFHPKAQQAIRQFPKPVRVELYAVIAGDAKCVPRCFRITSKRPQRDLPGVLFSEGWRQNFSVPRISEKNAKNTVK